MSMTTIAALAKELQTTSTEITSVTKAFGMTVSGAGGRGKLSVEDADFIRAVNKEARPGESISQAANRIKQGVETAQDQGVRSNLNANEAQHSMSFYEAQTARRAQTISRKMATGIHCLVPKLLAYDLTAVLHDEDTSGVIAQAWAETDEVLDGFLTEKDGNARNFSLRKLEGERLGILSLPASTEG